MAWAGQERAHLCTCKFGTFFQIPLALTIPISNNFQLNETSEETLIWVLLEFWSYPNYFSQKISFSCGKVFKPLFFLFKTGLYLRRASNKEFAVRYSRRNLVMPILVFSWKRCCYCNFRAQTGIKWKIWKFFILWSI